MRSLALSALADFSFASAFFFSFSRLSAYFLASSAFSSSSSWDFLTGSGARSLDFGFFTILAAHGFSYSGSFTSLWTSGSGVFYLASGFL